MCVSPCGKWSAPSVEGQRGEFVEGALDGRCVAVDVCIEVCHLDAAATAGKGNRVDHDLTATRWATTGTYELVAQWVTA